MVGRGTTGIPGANVTISISYQPADDAPARPVVELAVEHGSVEVSPNGTVIRFYSQSVLRGATVEEVRGSVEGEVGDEDIPETEIVATVDPDVDGRLNWIIRCG